MAPPAQAARPDDGPVAADPWINDPRAAPGGTVVARVPDGFFEAMASGDPEQIAKLRLQDSRGKPLQTDAAAFQRPAAPSLRRPGDSPRDGGRKPRVNKRVVGGSRPAAEPAKPASRSPAGPKKVSSSGWTISSGQRRKSTRIEEEPVDASRGRGASNKPAPKPASPAAPKAATEPDIDTEATVAKAVEPPPKPRPKPKPQRQPQPQPKPAKPARAKTGKTSSLVARLRQRAGLESPDDRRNKRAEPSEAGTSDDADEHTVARAHRMPEDEQTRIAARDAGDDDNTRIAATPGDDEESTRIAHRDEVERRRPDPGLDAPTQNMVVDEAFTRVANPGLDGPTQNVAPLDDESTRVGQAPGGADGPTHDIELDDDEFEALQTEVVDNDGAAGDASPDAPDNLDDRDDRTVARAVPDRDDGFEDDQRTRLFRREDDE
jgi:hypothetical protein